MDKTNTLAADLGEIRRALSALLVPGQTTELRALDVSAAPNRRRCTIAGYFDDHDALAKAAGGLDGAKGVYIVPNPINAALLARAYNRTREVGVGDATSDKDIVRRHWMLIDVDAAPVAGVSTTEVEHEAALAAVRAIREALAMEGWPEPILADSGNGGHILYRVDLPADDDGLVKRCLRALAFRFNDEALRVDESVHNAGRIWKLYGTPARKGDNTPDRPHRLSRLINVPETLEVVPRGLLVRLAGSLPVDPTPNTTRASLCNSEGNFDLESWVQRFVPDARGPMSYGSGRKWVLPACPWNDHRDGSAFVLQFPSGAIAAGCLHNSCRAKTWADLREHFEPGYRHGTPTDRNSVHSVHSVQAGGAPEPWDLPVPFFHADLPVFPTDALPGYLREFVEAVSIAKQAPPDLAALLSLSVLATACAKRVEVQVRDGWTEPVNLFTCTILPPGSRKTPVFTAVSEPLDEFERSEGQRMGPLVAEAAARLRILENRLQQVQAQAAKTNPEEADGLVREAAELAREVAGTHVPVAPRLIADDATSEKLASMLRDQAGKMAVLSPEGDIFDIMSGRYGNGANIGVFLKGHAGDTLRVDRVNRPAEYVKAPALTLGLAVQPDVIRGLVAQPSFRGRGLLGRFLYAWPPSPLGSREVGSPAVPETVAAAYRRSIQGLLSITPAIGKDGESTPSTLSMSASARVRLQAFERWIEPQLADAGDLAAIPDWAGKLVGAVARIAGLLHMAAQHAGERSWGTTIDEDTVVGAIRIGEYLIPHALATFTEMGANADTEAARYVLTWIRKEGRETFTKRDAHYGCRGRLRRAEDVGAALRLLVQHGYIRERPAEAQSGRGRPASPSFDVCPQIWGTPSTDHFDGRLLADTEPMPDGRAPIWAEQNEHNAQKSNVVELRALSAPGQPQAGTDKSCVVCGNPLSSGEWLRCRECGNAGRLA
ncbi:MAG: YfjI family protein [Chloroflexota bacterium]